MSRNRLIRRALPALLVAGGITATFAGAAGTAGAAVNLRPGVTYHEYQLTPTESWNACGGSGAVIRYDDGTALNCATGVASWWTAN